MLGRYGSPQVLTEELRSTKFTAMKMYPPSSYKMRTWFLHLEDKEESTYENKNFVNVLAALMLWLHKCTSKSNK